MNRTNATQHHSTGVSVKVSEGDSDGKSFGYGLYVNASIDQIIYASECVAKDSSADAIQAARRRVLARARGYIRRHRDEFI